MLSGFLSDFGRKLAERWATVVVLPGLLFTAASSVAVMLGQQRWWDARLLWRKLAEFTSAGGAGQATGSLRTAVLFLGVVAVSVAAAAVAGGLAGPAEGLLLGRWPRLFGPLSGFLTRRRRNAWDRRERACQDLRAERAQALAEQDTAVDADARETARRAVAVATSGLGELEALRNDIALLEPACPTWAGDRLRALAERVRQQYRLDAGDAWPRLWLLLPDSARQPLSESRQHVNDALLLGGWAVLYVALGMAWWPSAVAGVVAGVVAWRRARTAVGGYAELVEATVDVYVRDLLDRFDEEARPIRLSAGAAVTEIFRKGGGPRHRY